MVPGHDLSVDQAHHHVRQDDEGQELTGRRARQPLRLHQEGQPPQQQEHHRRELRGEVHPQPQPGAGLPPRRGDLTPYVGRAQVRKRRRLVSLGVVLQEQQQQDEDDDARRRAARERRRPAHAVQQPCQQECGDEVARHARETRELRDQRTAPGGEPPRAEPQHADERHRVTAAQQGPRGEGHAVRRREGEAQLARREQHHAQGQHLLGAEPVDQQADGYLHARVDEELQDGERRQGRGVDVEAVRGVETGDTEGRTEDDGDEVDRDAYAPDGHGATAAWRCRLRGRVAGQCGGLHRSSPRARCENQPMCRWTVDTAASASPERRA